MTEYTGRTANISGDLSGEVRIHGVRMESRIDDIEDGSITFKTTAVIDAADLLGWLRAQGYYLTRNDPDWEFNSEDPDDCRKAARAMIGSAAGLCAGACGALMDCDEPDVRKHRPTLLRYRAKLNELRAALSTTKEGEQ